MEINVSILIGSCYLLSVCVRDGVNIIVNFFFFFLKMTENLYLILKGWDVKSTD